MNQPSAHIDEHRFFPGGFRSAIIALFAFMMLQGLTPPLVIAGQAKSEHEVKAAWLAKFLHYVQWPEKMIPKTGVPMTIGFLGADPLAAEVNGLVSDGYNIKGHSLVVRRSGRHEDLKGCQILFISKSAGALAKATLAAFQGSGVLILSDAENFLENGGMIGFRAAGDQVKFQINNTLARKEGIRIAGDLLAIAEKVK